MRTLNDIVPPSRRKDGEGEGRRAEPLIVAKRPPRFSHTSLLAILFVIAVSVGVLFYFSTAKVEITPSSISAAVQNTFTATPSGDLPYEVITVEKVASQSVASSGSKTESSPASGTLTIYNTQSKPQTLVANTRFAAPTGLIFRIRSEVTIPAGTTVKPGAKAVTVYADQPGPAYNVGPASFTIPGFAGTAQASQVYARSTVAMTGGASGAVPVVDPAVLEKTRASLIAALGPDLTKALTAEVNTLSESASTKYVLLPGAAATAFEAVPSTPGATTGMVDVKEKGIIRAVVFRDEALARAIGLSIAGLEYQGEPITLASASNLTLVADEIPTASDAPFSFTLSGTASLVYAIDSARIAASVSGKSKSAAEVAITNYPEVKRAVIVLRPFWRTTFPEDPAAISIRVVGSGN
ncbi:hypothetical protein HYV30_03310 [Candidatus Kaiserbacteria bacterium]|nr:hypothetical protein [Candidatus Kaiserbacteria bacterium]